MENNITKNENEERKKNIERQKVQIYKTFVLLCRDVLERGLWPFVEMIKMKLFSLKSNEKLDFGSIDAQGLEIHWGVFPKIMGRVCFIIPSLCYFGSQSNLFRYV